MQPHTLSCDPASLARPETAAMANLETLLAATPATRLKDEAVAAQALAALRRLKDSLVPYGEYDRVADRVIFDAASYLYWTYPDLPPHLINRGLLGFPGTLGREFISPIETLYRCERCLVPLIAHVRSELQQFKRDARRARPIYRDLYRLLCPLCTDDSMAFTFAASQPLRRAMGELIDQPFNADPRRVPEIDFDSVYDRMGRLPTENPLQRKINALVFEHRRWGGSIGLFYANHDPAALTTLSTAVAAIRPESPNKAVDGSSSTGSDAIRRLLEPPYPRHYHKLDWTESADTQYAKAILMIDHAEHLSLDAIMWSMQHLHPLEAVIYVTDDPATLRDTLHQHPTPEWFTERWFNLNSPLEEEDALP